MTDKPKKSLLDTLGLGSKESQILAGLNNAAAASKVFTMTADGIKDANGAVVAKHAAGPAQGVPPIPASFDPHIEMENGSAIAYIPHQICVRPIYDDESETLLRSRARAELWKSMFK